eukprot:TRINITY_DN7956_c0_g1_i1.p1 TRINITY_DN7956_c0_g1~~TRINITY_DN7956_c0_g1_i1.p1  ORF type:complete len:363 (-),score=52.91 TRINITY_DN7956_c0_g1_i1:15-1103(-)
MKLSCEGLFLIIHCILYSAEATKYGYFSSCDVIPQSKKWNKNHGFELQAWIQSVVPYPPNTSEGFVYAGFTSSDAYVKVTEVFSESRISWKAYGSNRLDGWLYGVRNIYHKFIPRATYYIFPDYKTAFLGTFENDEKMLEGVAVRITHFRCNQGVLELKFSSPKPGSTVFRSIERNHTFASETPHERDPLGRKNVYVGSSINVPSIANQDALFAKRDIAPHSLVAYYGGIWETYEEPYFTPNMTEAMKEDKHKNLMSFNDTHSIDVTPEMSFLTNYLSTLGHKANHHFLSDNVNFGFAKHPVFGQIRCLESKKLIERGEEILINYGYNPLAVDSPQWYKDMYLYIFPHEQNATMTLIEDIPH